MNGEEQPQRMHGLEALRQLVDARAKANQLSQWSRELAALQNRVSSASSSLEWQYNQALQAFEKAVGEAPDELTVSVSDGALRWIGEAGAEVSRVEAEVRAVLRQIEKPS